MFYGRCAMGMSGILGMEVHIGLPIIGYHLMPEEYKNFNVERFATGITLQTAVDSKEEAIELMRKIQVI